MTSGRDSDDFVAKSCRLIISVMTRKRGEKSIPSSQDSIKKVIPHKIYYHYAKRLHSKGIIFAEENSMRSNRYLIYGKMLRKISRICYFCGGNM